MPKKYNGAEEVMHLLFADNNLWSSQGTVWTAYVHRHSFNDQYSQGIWVFHSFASYLPWLVFFDLGCD